ncbi:hypothetical protein [Curtobacterium aurantiacum]|uniref:hypothetical protein n=1 Tax=Curtobacterium aurantiacum TaxID=3236919 RepID=UPI001BDE92E6|nr:hypothetical protein [Curtobacterium flaccumfaciens]MBT1679786.1 hypothetical protein [Curtobacterium flaccumfaciens pv. flaccumfaciens]
MISAQLGDRVEALDGVSAAQPPPSGRWTLSLAALEQLWSVRSRGLVSVAARRSQAGVELREAGLTGRFGALSDEGARFVRLLDEPDARFGATATLRGKKANWGMWLGKGSALVRAQGSVPDLVASAEERDAGRFDLLPPGRAIGHLMAWTGHSPAWAVALGDPFVVPTSDVNRRVDGEPVSMPETTDPLMQRLWSAPNWTRVRVWSEATGRGAEWISAGAGGNFRTHLVGDGSFCRIELVPGGTVFRDVLSVFQDGPPANVRPATIQ